MTLAVQASSELLGPPLPRDESPAVLRCAEALHTSAERLRSLAQGLGALVPVQHWSGASAAAADDRLIELATSLILERGRLLRAADALRTFARALGVIADQADEAKALISAAQQTQDRVDRLDPGLAAARAAGSWSGHRTDGHLYDPVAIVLLHRAREAAQQARDGYTRAARALTDELTGLSGRRVVRASLSSRTWLDVAGFVPVLGDAVDAVNAVVYLRQRRWSDAALTGAAVVPGPEGWLAGGGKIARAVGHVGDVERVVDSSPQRRVADVLSGLDIPGRTPWTRMLPDDATIESLYREVFEPLGTTTMRSAGLGPVWVTELPGGGAVIFRRHSSAEGAAIDFHRLPDLSVTKIHRPKH